VKRVAASEHDETPDLADRLQSLGEAQNAIDLTLRGYAVVRDAVPLDFVDRLRACILKCFAAARTPVLVGMLLKEDKIFEEAVCNPKLVALAEFICGQGFILNQVVGTVRGPGDSGLPIHTDYNFIRDPFPPFPLVMNTVWACDDFTEAGGCSRVVPRSHLARRHPVPLLGEGEDEAVPIECPRGAIVIWDGAIWHGSCPRRISGRRVALHVRYNRMVLRPFERYDLPHKVLDRNPPVFASMLGMNDPFEKSTSAGVDMDRARQADLIFRT
jgi:ectoine hydroxylase-related dioxygenase (phytanoyl-CoA dioxygenase family)